MYTHIRPYEDIGMLQYVAMASSFTGTKCANTCTPQARPRLKRRRQGLDSNLKVVCCVELALEENFQVILDHFLDFPGRLFEHKILGPVVHNSETQGPHIQM